MERLPRIVFGLRVSFESRRFVPRWFPRLQTSFKASVNKEEKSSLYWKKTSEVRKERKPSGRKREGVEYQRKSGGKKRKRGALEWNLNSDRLSFCRWEMMSLGQISLATRFLVPHIIFVKRRSASRKTRNESSSNKKQNFPEYFVLHFPWDYSSALHLSKAVYT